MSGNCEAFKLREEDVMKFLACQTHVGANNVDFQMEQYVWKRKLDGTYIINLKRTWEKLLLAARAIAAIENPADICVISARPYAQRAILKFAAHTGSTPVAGRFTPGTFTNQIQKAFREPRLLVVTDPRVDHQAITEASYVNIPVISFCNTDSPVKLIDIAIPCNNKGQRSVGLMWWMLAREVLLIKGKINRATGFMIDEKEIMPDLYFYRDPEEEQKVEQVAERGPEEPMVTDDRWGTQMDVPIKTEDTWKGGMSPAAATEPPKMKLGGDFSGMPTPQITDWAQETQQWSASAGDWGGGPDSKNW